MSSLFVSYSGADRELAEQLRSELRLAGFGTIFLDVDPVDGIALGRKWEAEIYVALRRTFAVIFLLSDTSAVSQWCFAELALARSLGKAIYPVRVNGDAQLDLIADTQEVDLRATGTAGLVSGLRRAGLRQEEAFAWDPSRSPYPGLEAFGPEDAAVFFGRQAETGQILDLLQPSLARGAGRWVCLVGPSGSGKSSLLRAGVLPRLARLPSKWSVLPPFTPGTQPVRNLARALSGPGRLPDVAEVEYLLAAGEAAALLPQLADVSEATGTARRILVVIDQLEELVTRTGNRERQAFLRALADLLHRDSPLWVISTMRSEFLSTAPERSGLFEIIDDPVVIEPLSRARLPEVVAAPAARVGLEFEPGLVEAIVEDTTGGDALPLLAHTLFELAKGTDRLITFEAYGALGGVVGSLQRKADELVADLTRRGNGPLIVPTLLRLASVDEDGLPVRRRLPLSVFTDDERDVIDAFVDGRLLTTNSGNGIGTSVEVAHEALLRQWGPLRQAIETSRESLRRRAEIGREAADWLSGGRDDSYLLRGERLAVFEEWMAQNPVDVDPLEQEYLQASRAAEMSELHAVRRNNRRLRLLSTGLAGLLAIALIAGLLAVQGRQEASRQAALALSRQLLAQADLVRQQQPDVGLLLNVEALRRSTPAIADEARYALVDGLSRTFHRSTLLPHGSAVNRVDFSPDDGLLATAGEDGVVDLWKVGSAEPVGRFLSDPPSPVRRVAFSPDGRTLVAVSRTSVRLWQVATLQPVAPPLQGHQGEVYEAVFSPDGSVLATGSADHTVRLWNTATGAPIGPPLSGHTEGVFDLAFSPDGRTLASTGWDATVRLWDVATGRPGPVLLGHEQANASVAFSPDGRMIISAGADGTVRTWDAATGAARHVLRGHRETVSALAVSPDGATIASGGVDREIRLWDAATGTLKGQPLVGHSDVVMDLVFTPDGDTLVSASNDGSLRLWDARTGAARGAELTGHTGWIDDVDISSDGHLIASASGDGTARLWDLAETTPIGLSLTQRTEPFADVAFDGRGRLAAATGSGAVWLWEAASGAPPHDLPGHRGKVNAVAFARDGRLLASAGDDGTIRLWDPDTRQLVRTPIATESAELDVAFSPDARMLASAGADGVVRLWDVPSGRSLGVLAGHQGAVRSVVFSPTGRLVSGGDDRVLRWWDPVARTLAQPSVRAEGAVQDMAFSPDGRELAAAGADAAISFWDAATGARARAPITGFTSWVNKIAFSRDGATIASAADEGLRFWAVDSGRPRGRVLVGAYRANGVAFAPDGLTVASAEENGVRSWDIRAATLTSTACRIANRNLSAAEWASFFGQQTPYLPTCP